MEHVKSRDGTLIAYERVGSGPAVILVGGALDDGSENAPLMPLLADAFTTYNYARRGRGGSGDTPPYSVEREVEDLDALVAEAGGTAHLFGASSGGALVLAAAAAGVPARRLAVYEVPYATSDVMLRRWAEFGRQVGSMLDAGRRGDALALFMRTAGSSEDEIAGARNSPHWPHLEALAHTLAHDQACMDDYRVPRERIAAVAQPTLVITGGKPIPDRAGMANVPADYIDAAGDVVAASLPHAERCVLPGQGHVADPNVLAPQLTRFFTE